MSFFGDVNISKIFYKPKKLKKIDLHKTPNDSLLGWGIFPTPSIPQKIEKKYNFHFPRRQTNLTLTTSIRKGTNIFY